MQGEKHIQCHTLSIWVLHLHDLLIVAAITACVWMWNATKPRESIEFQCVRHALYKDVTETFQPLETALWESCAMRKAMDLYASWVLDHRSAKRNCRWDAVTHRRTGPRGELMNGRLVEQAHDHLLRAPRQSTFSSKRWETTHYTEPLQCDEVWCTARELCNSLMIIWFSKHIMWLHAKMWIT